MAKVIKRRKITRHELKEDRFLEATKNFITFFRANTSRIILTTIIVIAIIVAVRIYFSNRNASEESGRVKKLYADALYENGNFKEAVAAYQEIIKMHGGTRTARISTLFLANSYFFSGDNENALQYYEKSLKILRKSPVWASAAEIGIGSVFEQKGSFEDAITYYDNVITKYRETPFRIDALFSKARCLEFLNRYDEAMKVYAVVESEYSDTDFAEDAKKRVVFLRGATESDRIPK
ncbi:MAG: tetratricopeptide repeat protein [Candidatus Cloacimonadota bacterium]|nr:MAG: tetratricopeptide repeat protein [Candidatus Cloacimonadota bacterium]